MVSKNINNFIYDSVIAFQDNGEDKYKEDKNNLGYLVNSLREKNNHGKDKIKLFKVLDDYKKYKRDYSRNIKFEPNEQSLSKDDI